MKPSCAPSLLGLLLLAAPLGADTRDDVAALFAEARYGAAYELTAGIDDPGLAAEWRFHLLFTGGDLPGALAAARAGLEGAPDHAGLLANAVHVATLLGLGQEALGWSEQLAALPAPEGETAEQRAAREARTGNLVAAARRVSDLEAAGEAGRRRAWRVATGGLAGALLALLALSRLR